MKKIVCLILAFSFIFVCSCDEIKSYNETKDTSKITIEEPTKDSLQDYELENTDETTILDDTSSTESNISDTTTDNSDTIDENSSIITDNSTAAIIENKDYNKFDGTYYANMNTRKFHKSTCSSAKLIKDTNLYITTSREELINDGYSPCLRCNP